jgi:hypothetical protein
LDAVKNELVAGNARPGGIVMHLTVGICAGMVVGISETLRMFGTLCPPDGVSNEQLVRIVVNQIERNSILPPYLAPLRWPAAVSSVRAAVDEGEDSIGNLVGAAVDFTHGHGTRRCKRCKSTRTGLRPCACGSSSASTALACGCGARRGIGRRSI